MERKVIEKNYEVNGVIVRGLNIDGQAFMVGRDVAEAMGYKNPSVGVSAKVKPTHRHLEKIEVNHRMQKTSVVDELGAFRLITGTPSKELDEYQEQFAFKVIPNLRNLHLTMKEGN